MCLAVWEIIHRKEKKQNKQHNENKGLSELWRPPNNAKSFLTGCRNYTNILYPASMLCQNEPFRFISDNEHLHYVKFKVLYSFICCYLFILNYWCSFLVWKSPKFSALNGLILCSRTLFLCGEEKKWVTGPIEPNCPTHQSDIFFFLGVSKGSDDTEWLGRCQAHPVNMLQRSTSNATNTCSSSPHFAFSVALFLQPPSHLCQKRPSKMLLNRKNRHWLEMNVIRLGDGWRRATCREENVPPSEVPRRREA